VGLGRSFPYGVQLSEKRIFLLAVGVVTVIAALDAAIGVHAVLIELTLLGPLVAAFGATTRHTALVAIYAFLVSIPLGFTSDSPGSTEHVSGVIVVALGGAFTVAISRVRAARERNASRLLVQYRVARVLAEAESLEEAAPRLLEAIGAPLGWEVGHLWEPNERDVLRCAAAWRAPGVEARRFVEATRALEPRSGVGLPGKVWEAGRAIWLADVVADENFPRADAAAREGLRDGIAFPVRAGGGCAAVIEFFAREVPPPGEDLLDLTAALGSQIGEFVERLRVADAVRHSEARKGAVLASALDGVITIDHDGRVVEFNPAAERIFDRPAAEAIGREMAELVVPPSLRERHRAALRRIVQTGESRILGRRLELTGMRRDGGEFPVELAINRIGDREPPMFTGTVRDITDRRRSEREREEARDQLAAILGGVADAITAQAPDGGLLFANDAAVRTLGFRSSAALLEAPLAQIMDRFDVFDEEGAPFPLERLPGRRALAGERAEEVVRFRVRETGEERWSAVKASPIRDDQGRVTMAINVIEDITAHKRAERAQRFLSDSSAVLGASHELEEVLGQVANLAVPQMADWSFVDLVVEGKGIERIAAAHADPTLVARARELYLSAPPDSRAAGGVAQALRAGRAELHPDLHEELSGLAADAPYFRLARAFRMRSMILAPMIARGRTFGALTFATGASGRRFDHRDLELAEELAQRCATAIDNARLFSERAYIARTLQQSLLPVELPDIPGIESAARFRPTGEGNEVGGDFYDLFETGGRGWTAVMGDVCGKGPDAAAVTALARYTLRAAAMRERLPSRSLGLLNEALLRQRTDRRFCTVAYAYLETRPDGAQVGFASGGHPLPLLLHADGTVEQVGAPGTLLGVLPDPRFEDRSLSLVPGDALVFYTDGVIEGRGANGIVDEATLAEVVAACAGHGADAIAAQVEDAAVAVHGGNPRDDIAVLVLRVAV